MTQQKLIRCIQAVCLLPVAYVYITKLFIEDFTRLVNEEDA